MNRFPAIVFAVLALGTSAVCAEGVADVVSVADPYARAVPPGQSNSAIFMELANGSDGAHALVAAESPAADVVELHTHSMEGGMMRMRRVKRIELAAGETVTLQPGGFHVMLIGLKSQLEPGQQVGLTLVFEDGSRTLLEVPVRKISAGGGHGESGSCGSGR